MAFMPSVACSLVLKLWATVSFSHGGEFRAPFGEDTFEFLDMLWIMFIVGAIFSWKPVLDTFTPVWDGALDELLMMLQATITFFG